MPNQQQPSTTYYPHQSSPQQQHIPQQQQQFNPGFYDGRYVVTLFVVARSAEADVAVLLLFVLGEGAA